MRTRISGNFENYVMELNFCDFICQYFEGKDLFTSTFSCCFIKSFVALCMYFLLFNLCFFL